MVRWKKSRSFSFTDNIWCLLCCWTITALLPRKHFQLSTYNPHGPLKQSKTLQYAVINWNMTPNSWGNLWPEQSPSCQQHALRLSCLPQPSESCRLSPWELRGVLLTPKHKSSSSGWNSRTSCWSCSLPRGLVLDMSLQHFCILLWLLAQLFGLQGQTGMVTAAQPGLLSDAATQIRTCCLAAAWN